MMTEQMTASGRWVQQPDGGWQRAMDPSDLRPRAVGWRTPALGTNVTDYDTSTFFGPRFRREGNLVVLRGLMKATGAIASAGVLFTLPAGFRPAHQMIFPVQWAWGQTRMDINTVGQAFLQGQALALNDWVSFNGITFTAER